VDVDVFIGTASSGLRAALLTTDTLKGDRELKLLWNMRDDEIAIARAFLDGDTMRVMLRMRSMNKIKACATNPGELALWAKQRPNPLSYCQTCQADWAKRG
jgi:hypothetical protein